MDSIASSIKKLFFQQIPKAHVHQNLKDVSWASVKPYCLLLGRHLSQTALPETKLTAWIWEQAERRRLLSSHVALQNAFRLRAPGLCCYRDKADQMLMLLVCVQCLRTCSQRREAAFSSEKSGFIGWATECHLVNVLGEATKEGGG